MSSNAAATIETQSLEISSIEPKLERCPICESRSLRRLFISEGTPIARCDECSLVMRNPQPSDKTLGEIYSADYFLGGHSPEHTSEVNRIKRLTAALYLDQIEHELKNRGAKLRQVRLLEVGCGHGNFLAEAASRGWEVTGIEYSSDSAAAANRNVGRDCVLVGSIETVDLPEDTFDVCVIADVIEHTREPARFLREVNRVLKPGGLVYIAVPSLDSRSAKMMGEKWMEYKLEHLFYFNRDTIRNILFREGFEKIEVSSGKKILTLDYIAKHFQRFPVQPFTAVLGAVTKILPRGFLDRPFEVVASGVTAMARKSLEPAPCTRKHLLSVILPAFNERDTVREVLSALLKKEIPGMDMEIIVVESNSKDGTRGEVLAFKDNPRVKLLLEDAPRGKGHAVRAGLEVARGDFILIQDADLEYDLNDYEELLAPLANYRRAFVLGSRHIAGASWKIRHFADQLLTSSLMNLGHLFFTTMFNVLYRQKLRDPFTMYKVFRRDCIHNLRFECNRFDFDCELIAKLVRNGFSPVEIPVNYRSRSFNEGKKVSFFGDPPTYIKAFLKYRFSAIN